MKKRVVITGLGVISPVGNDTSSFWQSLTEGKSGVGPITSFDAVAFDSRIAAEVKNFDPTQHGISLKDVKRTAKFVQFAVAAAKQAVKSSG
ncbi:MAG: beta-ketoacyl synthase N-terminal-like domain-containing protein, partial [Candidatus Omnitrophota bacterium]